MLIHSFCQKWISVLIGLIFLFSGPLVLAQNNGIRTIVTLLGTGTPRPNPDRLGPSTLVEVNGMRLLFDVGVGATQRLTELNISLGSISHVFLTHYHSDHINGLPDLLLTGWLAPPFGQRTEPLPITGPGKQEMKNLTRNLRQAYKRDIEIRIVDENLPVEGSKFEVTSFRKNKDGVVFTHVDEGGTVTVEAFAVDHGEFIKPAVGYRVNFEPSDGSGLHSATISGDTRFDPNLIEAAQGTELLIHEVAAAHEGLTDALPSVQNILDHHTTPTEAGQVFTAVSPSLAVYTHLVLLTGLGFEEVTFEEIIKETRVEGGYNGPLEVGVDGMSIGVGAGIAEVVNRDDYIDILGLGE
jgi:ribonuclease Z